MSKFRILNIVVDSLYLRIYHLSQPSHLLLTQVPLWRQYLLDYERGDSPYFLEIPELGTFRLKVGGRAPYEFVLINPQIADIRIWNIDKWDSKAAAQTGQIFVDFRSRFLQKVGLDGVDRFRQILKETFFGEEVGLGFCRVARMDLAVDITDDVMQWSDLDNFMCRAKKVDVFTHVTSANILDILSSNIENAPTSLDKSASMLIKSFLDKAIDEVSNDKAASLSRVVTQNRTPQTIYFGRFGSQLYARKYNKLLTLPVQNKMYMLDIWKQAGWDGEQQVNRIEFSISGDFLKDYVIGDHKDCRDFEIIRHVIPTLWNYLVTQWLTFRTPNFDDNRSRWPIAFSWLNLVNAFGEDLYEDSYRDNSRKVPEFDEHLYKQALGCLISAAALKDSSHSSDADIMTDVASRLLHSFNDDFAFLMAERRYEFGLDNHSDTSITALIREEKMTEGNGS